ncbi:MAG: GatB/YqeY domain-containing protein [Verrucomicrobia bacterium]|nr:GatB/YqeY domain-containing protein [Verrucomicrobiota bacterium]
MSLALKIDEQIKEAMKAKDADRLGVLRMLKSAMKYAVIEKYGAEGEAKDEDVLAAVRKEIKKRQDSIEAFEKGGRPEQVTKEKAEMKILEAYLPAAMSEADLETLVKAVIAELGATDKKAMGAVMKACQAKAAGRADNRALSALVGKLLP